MPKAPPKRKRLLPQPLDCLKSWSLEMHSKASRVRQLIGDKHWLMDGFQKEGLLKQFLIDRLPNSLQISRGFVMTGKSGKVSPEVDILISSPEISLLWFSEGDLQITPPSSVVSHIHVKTTLGAATLDDALRTLDSTAELCETFAPESPPWSCAFFFATGKQSPKDSADLISQSINKAFQAGRILPSCVCSLNGPFAIIKEIDPHSSDRRLLVFDTGQLSPAALLIDLYGSLPGNHPAHRTEMEHLIAAASVGNIIDTQLTNGKK
jgi:hypothetical protein